MPRFSIVYPTRNRPHFIAEALRILALQKYSDFEVVVSDNFSDPELSCQSVCEDAAIPVKYVRPKEPVGMVENWNRALAHATGEYVCVLTDKMFILPRALERVDRAIRSAGTPDIVSWVSDAYNPSSSIDYFGAGRYFRLFPHPRIVGAYTRFDPSTALNEKGRADVARSEQSNSSYCRGKIVFGVYHRELISRIEAKYEALFHNISPDYTSMVLGLSAAASAIEMSQSCVVSVNTPISNGFLCDTSDAAALAYQQSLAGGTAALFEHMLAPGLYASISNAVAHDYLSLKNRFDLPFEFDAVNWLTYCIEEIHRPERVWSSADVEATQKRLLSDYIATLSDQERTRLRTRLSQRGAGIRLEARRPPEDFPTDSLLEAVSVRAEPASLLRRFAEWLSR